MLADLPSGFDGVAASWLKVHAESRAELLLQTLLSQAVTLWSDESFSSYGRLEPHFTVRLFFFCTRIIAEHHRFYAQVEVMYEAAQPTADMLAGKSDPSRTPNPDMTIIIGRTKVCVEAKRLKLTKGLPQLYVTEGIARFRDGRYGTQGDPGVMVGYVLSDDISPIIERINKVISSEWPPGIEEHLASATTLGTSLQVYKSEHPPSLKILHHLIDLRRTTVQTQKPEARGTSADKHGA